MSYIKSSDGLLINTDESHYRAVLAARESQKQARMICDQVNTLTEELNEIKALLAQTIHRNY
jgi:hypothetical protein